MHWCRHRVKFNEVPEKVPKVPEKVWFFLQRQVRFNRVPEKVPEKLLGSLGAKPSQVQRVPEKVAEKVLEKVLGIFGAGPDQFNRVSGKVPEKVWEALVQSQVTCNRVLEKVPLWCRAMSGSNRFKGFPALGFAARFRKICKNKTLRLLGIPPKLIFMNSFLALLN